MCSQTFVVHVISVFVRRWSCQYGIPESATDHPNASTQEDEHERVSISNKVIIVTIFRKSSREASVFGSP